LLKLRCFSKAFDHPTHKDFVAAITK